MGTSTRATSAASRSSSGSSTGGAVGSKVARCPPADGPCTINASAPRASAIWASSTLVTVATGWMPAFRGRTAIAMTWVTETNAIVSGLICQGGRIGLQLRRCARGWLGYKEIDSDRARRQLACRDDVFGAPLGRKKAGGDEAQTAGVCHCGDEFGCGRSTRHRRRDHRNIKLSKRESVYHS